MTEPGNARVLAASRRLASGARFSSAGGSQQLREAQDEVCAREVALRRGGRAGARRRRRRRPRRPRPRPARGLPRPAWAAWPPRSGSPTAVYAALRRVGAPRSRRRPRATTARPGHLLPATPRVRVPLHGLAEAALRRAFVARRERRWRGRGRAPGRRCRGRGPVPGRGRGGGAAARGGRGAARRRAAAYIVIGHAISHSASIVSHGATRGASASGREHRRTWSGAPRLSAPRAS